MTIYLTGVTNPAITAYAATEPRLGLIVTPRSGLVGQVQNYRAWAADNGAYAAHIHGQPFPLGAWLRFLDKLPPGALFVVVPDVVADHVATAEMWADHAHHVTDRGHRPAYVLQDGCTELDQVPGTAQAVFIGGTDAYKTSNAAGRVTWRAREAGLWVHMGRVNSEKRWLRALAMGADSADGTFLRFGSPAEMTHRLSRWLHAGQTKGGQLSLTEQT